MKGLRLGGDFNVLANCDDGTSVTFDYVDFGDAYTNKTLQLHLSNGGGTGKWIKVLIDGYAVPNNSRINVPATGSYGNFQTVSSSLGLIQGTHKLTLQFYGGSGVANVDWFKISQ
ncbi:carbohydrate-binding protein [Brucepastera parasyntrophica]|uniref:carbohydrate-binding protein n=1 Tax=Brucepastera parasyntrophica TaxID=2880008 RepID=UPI0021095346|nr:carbohydrate-binding protein [Brucepastera parasyntrophica]ULQ59425.1 carbohydrate-binding protein [Brucepastera parasyntrophica]